MTSSNQSFSSAVNPILLFFCHLFQILPKVLPQVQSELSEECGKSTGHAQIPGNSSVQVHKYTARSHVKALQLAPSELKTGETESEKSCAHWTEYLLGNTI